MVQLYFVCKLVIEILLLQLLFISGASAQQAMEQPREMFSNSTRENTGTITKKINGNGLCFTPNKGQIADMDGKLCPDILYKGTTPGADIYLRKTGISYVFSNMAEVMHEVHEKAEEMEHSKEGLGGKTEGEWEQELIQKESIKMHRVDMDFAHCNQNIAITNEHEADGYLNFYYAHCPQGITNVKQFNKVTYKNIYNNIDVSYYGDKTQGIKYDLIVQPHAAPNQIKLRWNGAENIHINREGNLVIKTSVNEFTESIPKVYQVINGKVVDVKAKYILTLSPKGRAGEGLVSFSFGEGWDEAFPLIIDPWATYYGGNADDYSTGIATDNTGNVVISGCTTSTDFPVLGASQATIGGGLADAFAVKFNLSGTRLWATYYGGNSLDQTTDIAADISGNVVIIGFTYSANFPVGAAGGNIVQQSILAGMEDAFIVKFDPFGLRLWASYYGGKNSDRGYAIATDNIGNVVATGSTSSFNFPVGAAAGYTCHQPVGSLPDAFILKISPLGALLWGTFYGAGAGLTGVAGQGIAIDIAGDVIVSGYTNSPSFPVGATASNVVQQSTYGGGLKDVFVVKFNTTGNFQWATFYGGSAEDWCVRITTDNAKNVIITGYTASPNFPVGAAGGNVVQQSTFGGFRDAFAVKLTSNGALAWATFYGNGRWEEGFDIAADGNNNIYLLMEEEDITTPSLVDACTWQPIFNGGSKVNIPGNNRTVEDQQIVKFLPTGQKICITYLGGTGEDDLDKGGGITVYGNSLFITGYTDGGYPVTAGAFQTIYGGNPCDVFVASICTNICEGKILGLNYTADTTSVCADTPITFTPSIANSCDTTGYRFKWTFTGGSPASSDSVKPTVIFSGFGTHDVKLVVTTPCKTDSITKSAFITVNNCACTLTGQFTKGIANCTNCGCKEWIMVTATGGIGPYSYTWPDGYTNRYKNQLCPGTYIINIKDKSGCSVNVNVAAP